LSLLAVGPLPVEPIPASLARLASFRPVVYKPFKQGNGSSGAAAAGALRIARRLGPGKTVVTLFPDGAERYPDQGIFERDRG